MADKYVDPAINANSGTGTIGDPFGDLQYALSNTTQGSWGDTFHIKAGTDEVLTAALSLATYGTPAYNKPLVFRGYTSAAGDGGIGGISGAATYTMLAATNYGYVAWVDMHLHNTGSADIVTPSLGCLFLRCELNNSTGHGINSGSNTRVAAVGCYLHDIGAAGKYQFFGSFGTIVYGCWCSRGSNSPDGLLRSNFAFNNILITAGATDGILTSGAACVIAGNTIFATSGTGEAIYMADTNSALINNIIQGFSGSGGDAAAQQYGGGFAIANAIYNNTNGLGITYLELNDSLGIAPFVDAVNRDFNINGTITGATEDGWPVSWPGLTTNTKPKSDKGAVQAGSNIGNLSNYGENALLTYLLSSTIYIALFSTAPGESGDGTELTGNGYARKSVSSSLWDISGNHASNDTAIEFDTATGDWPTVTHMAIFDAATNGNMLLYGALGSSVEIDNGESFQFGPGDIQIELD